MSTPRKWTTIREYEDILFDYYNGLHVSLSTVNVIGTLSLRPQLLK